MNILNWRCGRVRKMLDAFSRDGLPTAESAAVEAHLGRCPHCMHQYDTLFAVRCVLDNYPRITPRADFDEAILNAALAPRPVYIPMRPAARGWVDLMPRLRLASSVAFCAAICLMTLSMIVWPQLRPPGLSHLFGGSSSVPVSATLDPFKAPGTNGVSAIRSMPQGATAPAPAPATEVQPESGHSVTGQPEPVPAPPTP